MDEHTFDLVCDGVRKVVTVKAGSYEEAEAEIVAVRDRDFPGHEIADH